MVLGENGECKHEDHTDSERYPHIPAGGGDDQHEHNRRQCDDNLENRGLTYGSRIKRIPLSANSIWYITQAPQMERSIFSIAIICQLADIKSSIGLPERDVSSSAFTII